MLPAKWEDGMRLRNGLFSDCESWSPVSRELKQISHRTKFWFFIRYSLYSVMESGRLRKDDQIGFGVFEREVVWTIFDGKLEGGIRSRLMNCKFYQVYKEKDTVKRINYSRLRWAGHVARLLKERWNYIQQGPEKRRWLRRRPRIRFFFPVLTIFVILRDELRDPRFTSVPK